MYALLDGSVVVAANAYDDGRSRSAWCTTRAAVG
jgi:hypothetical protein